MNQIAILKLAIDAGLGISMLFLALRFFRSAMPERSIRQLAALDGSLKALIREAELSGSALNDQLLRRQQSLEGVLRETETAESRLQRALSGAEQSRADLDQASKQARTDYIELERQRVRTESARDRSIVHNGTSSDSHQNYREGESMRAGSAPATDSLRIEKTITPDSKNTPLQSEEGFFEADLPPAPISDPKPAVQAKVNIFGEPIEESAAAPVAPAPSLKSKLKQLLEKRVEKPAPLPDVIDPLSSVYEAAEEMLAAGKDIETVAARTNLPVEEVRYLNEMAARIKGTAEARSDESAEIDPRLGVLGAAMKRSVQAYTQE